MKKFLSLVLALVMVLSLGVTAGAVDFTDEAAITKTEAVGVLAGLGIINGYEAADGTFSFAPNGNITRGAAAKIICMIKLGTKVASILSCETAPFKDVAKDSTFAPYIAYCANEGIVGGYADGTFKPGNPVTGYAFTKMLLNALGIKGDYEGANYGVNVALAANEAKLFEGMDADTVYGANCIREDACQLAFNALTHTPDGAKSKFVVIDANENEIWSGTDALTALALAAVNGNKLTVDTSFEGSLGAKNFGLKKGTKTDEFGRKSTAYTNGKDVDDKDYVLYASFAPKAVLTYTTATTTNKVKNALGYKTSDEITFNIIHNGEAAASTDTIDTLSGQGTLVQIFKTADKKYDVVVIDTFVTTLASKNIVKAVPADNDNYAKAAYVWIDLNANDTEDKGETFETAAFKADDVVLYTVAKGAVYNIVKAASVVGKVTAIDGATTKTYFRVDGVQYKLAAQNGATIGNTDGYKYVTPAVTYTYYLDTYGNVIFAAAGDNKDDVKAQYTYVTQVAIKAADTKAVAGSDLFSGTSNTTAPVAQAKVVDLATGAISVKNIAIVKDTEGNYCFAKADGSADTTGLVPTATQLGEKNGKPQVVNGIYEYYTLADGSIVLADEEYTATQAVVAEKNVGTLNTGKTLYANAATKLTVVTLTFKDDVDTKPVTAASVTTVTGIANFPAKATPYGKTIVTAPKNSMATELVAIEYKAKETSAVNYAVYKAPGEIGADTKHAFYQNGAVVEFAITKDFDDDLTPGAVYDLTIVGGKLDEAKDAAAPVEATVTLVESTYMVVTVSGATEVIYFADGCQIYDADASYAADTIAAKDAIKVWTNAKGAAEFVIIDN